MPDGERSRVHGSAWFSYSVQLGSHHIAEGHLGLSRIDPARQNVQTFDILDVFQMNPFLQIALGTQVSLSVI